MNNASILTGQGAIVIGYGCALIAVRLIGEVPSLWWSVPLVIAGCIVVGVGIRKSRAAIAKAEGKPE